MESRERRQGGQLGNGLRAGRGGQPQAPQRVAATRVTEVNAGHCEVQRRLLVGFELEVAQVEVLGADHVTDLVPALDRDRRDLDSTTAERALVAFEGLATRLAFRGVTGDRACDLAKGPRPPLAQEQDQVRETLQPVHHVRQLDIEPNAMWRKRTGSVTRTNVARSWFEARDTTTIAKRPTPPWGACPSGRSTSSSR